MLLAACMIFMSQDDTFETLAFSISILLGGVLSAWIADKFFKVPFKDQCGKLAFPVMVFVLMAAVFWGLSCCFLFTSDSGRFPRYYGKMYPLSVLQLFGISWLTPVGEELTFRFSVLNLLRRKSRDPLRNAGAVLITAILSMIPHLLAGTAGVLDLFLFGCIAGFILVRTRSIAYPICFHLAANLTAMISYEKLSHAATKDWLWVTLPLAVCFLGGMMLAASKQQAEEEEEEKQESQTAAEPEEPEEELEKSEPVVVKPEEPEDTDPIRAYLDSQEYDEFVEDDPDEPYEE